MPRLGVQPPLRLIAAFLHPAFVGIGWGEALEGHQPFMVGCPRPPPCGYGLDLEPTDLSFCWFVALAKLSTNIPHFKFNLFLITRRKVALTW